MSLRRRPNARLGKAVLYEAIAGTGQRLQRYTNLVPAGSECKHPKHSEAFDRQRHPEDLGAGLARRHALLTETRRANTDLHKDGRGDRLSRSVTPPDA